MAVIRSGHFDRITVHHSAVSPGAKNVTEGKVRAKSYDASHAKKEWASTIKTAGEYGYKYIEYHYMITRDGALLQLQDEKYVLYHAGDNAKGKDSFNLHGIAVLLDGNYQTEKPTSAQAETLAKFIANFRKKHPGNWYVKGHKEVSLTATSCPGTNIGTSKFGWLKDVIALSNTILNPPVQVPSEPEPTPVDPKDQEIKDLKQKVADLERDKTVLSGLVTQKNGEIQTLTTEGNKIYSDVYTITKMLMDEAYGVEEIRFMETVNPVTGKPNPKYDREEPWDMQQYKYTGALAEIKNKVLNNTSVRDLLIAAINKIFGK